MYNRICVFEIINHIDQGCTGIEPVLLSLAEEKKQSALTTQPRKHIPSRNNGKYVDSRSNCVTTGRKIMNELQKLEYRLYINSSSHLSKHWYF